jgi:hypothetical protein
MATASEPLNRKAAALLLLKKHDDILREWEKQARTRVLAAKSQSHIGLMDSLPKFLQQLSATLLASNPKDEVKKILKSHAFMPKTGRLSQSTV